MKIKYKPFIKLIFLSILVIINFYKFGPKNITDVKIMVKRVTTYLNKIKLNEN